MKHKILRISILLLLFSSVLSGCGFQTPAATVEPTLNKAVENISDSPSPEPTPAYQAMTEADLAFGIHNTVGEVETAAKAATIMITEAKGNGRFSAEDMTEAMSHMQMLQSEALFARELANSYTDRYGELADETMALRLSIDEDLHGILTRSNEVITLLGKDEHALSTEIEQLSMALDSLANQSAQLHEQTGLWILDVQFQIEAREKFYANIPPQLNLVAYNRIDAFTQAHDFLDAFTAALNDEKLSSAELIEISQLAATAKSSLYNTGDPQLFTFAQQIDALSRQASRGEWTEASDGLVELKLSLPARPRP